ncbi:unnamed protein product, partial [Brachionus calyciflorus]
QIFYPNVQNFISLPVRYRSNSSAWMTGELWLDWLKWFDGQLEKPSLLLIDNCPAHVDCSHFNFKFLKGYYLAPNSTSHIQPLDGEFQKVTIKDEIYFLDDAWSLIDQGTIRRCWRHVDIMPDSHIAELGVERVPKTSKIDELVLLLKKLNEINRKGEFNLSVDWRDTGQNSSNSN